MYEHLSLFSAIDHTLNSIAEALIAKAHNICFDCPTRGLDANTAREYVKSLRALSNMANVVIAAALYQASESLFQRFDKVLVINEGRCLFFGPVERALPYFTDLGFAKPPRWTSAEFLVSITSHAVPIEKAGAACVPHDPAELERIFRGSEMARLNLNEIRTFEMEARIAIEGKHPSGDAPRNFQQPFWSQILACSYREILIAFGDKRSLVSTLSLCRFPIIFAYLWSCKAIKWGGIVFQALMIGALFVNLPQTTTGAFPRGGMIWILLLNNALIAMANLTSVFESRSVVFKHKSFTFYRPAAFALSQSLADAPQVLIQVFFSDIIV